jgi:hypothetical protein
MEIDRASNAATMRAFQAHPSCGPGAAEHLAIRKELDRVLASPAFRNSKRYASVLRYIVEQTLGQPDLQLKERTIGMEVFGRAPDYDTATDHVVRSALAEIRRRLAQYYQEQGPAAEVRIELQPGSYVPHFRTTPPERTESNQALLQFAAPAQSKPAALGSSWKWAAAGLFACIAIAVAAFAGLHRDPLERLWTPLLSSHRPVLLCVGNLAGGHQDSTDPLAPDSSINLVQFHELPSRMINVDDAITLANIVGFVKSKQIPYRIESQSRASYADLQAGPAVLIGLMNNDWTERLVSNLRFSVVHPTPWVYIIRDREHPSDNTRSIDYSVPYLSVTKDYALIVRASDPKTGQMVMTIAGLSVFGTLAAGQFVTDPQEIAKLDALAPKGWEKKNMEILLSTDVIRGEPGPPVIVATRFW